MSDISENTPRVMPYNANAEVAVIANMIYENECIPIALEKLKSEDFYITQYGVIYDAIKSLYNDGIKVEPEIVKSKLESMDVDPSISSLSSIAEAYDIYTTSEGMSEYVRIVKEKSTLRKIIRLCKEASGKCYKGVEPLEDIIEYTESNVYGLISNEGVGKYEPISDIVIRAVDKLDEVSKNKGQLTGIPTGFKDLDRVLNGLQNSDLILIAARPSMGKTAFALNIASHASLQCDKAVAIFSLEMSKEQLVNRLFSIEGQVDGSKLRNGELSDNDWRRIVSSSSSIGNSKIILDDTPGLTPSLLRSKCRQYKTQNGLDMIIIDYLQLMEGDSKYNRKVDNRQQEISDISRSLKLIARELNVPIVALSQLSRAVEGRADHRPQLSDLRESGAIEQDADVVMFLYREWVYDRENGDKNAAEVIVAKQRNGPIDNINLTWLSDFTKFENAAYSNDSAMADNAE